MDGKKNMFKASLPRVSFLPKQIYNAFPHVRAVYQPFECLWMKQVFERNVTGDQVEGSVMVHMPGMYAGQCDCKAGITEMMMVQFLLECCRQHLEYAKTAGSRNKKLAVAYADLNGAVEKVKIRLEACATRYVFLRG